MARPKKRPERLASGMLHVRVYPEEKAALEQLAETLGETPSRVIRSLIRAAITGGPDYFADGVYELRANHRHLAAVGRNLNQLVRSIHRGELVGGDDVRRAVNACTVQMEAVKQVYGRAVRATMQRIVLPLYEAAGLTLPPRLEASTTPAAARSGSRPPE